MRKSPTRRDLAFTPAHLSLIRLQNTSSPMNDSRRLGNTALEQFGELLGWHRVAEIVSLRFVAQASLKKGQLFRRFHSLGNDA
jgi:hypothetical protein